MNHVQGPLQARVGRTPTSRRGRSRKALLIAVSLALLATVMDLAPVLGADSVQNLSAAGQDAHSPQVAFDARGNAFVAWHRFDGANSRVQLRRRSASGSLSAVKTLSAAGQDANGQRLAVDAKGNAFVVWQRSDGTTSRIQLRRRSTTGNLGPVQTLSPAGKDSYDPRIAVDPKGNVIVAWTTYDPAGRIEFRRRSASGQLSAVKTLSVGSQEAEESHLAVDGNGNAIVVWEQMDGANERIQLRRRSASGGLSQVQNLSAAGQDGGDAQVTIGPKGHAIAVWYRSDGATNRIQLRRRARSGELGPVKTLSVAGQHAGSPRVASDARGNAIVVWRLHSASGRVIQLRRRSVSGGLSKTQTLSMDGQHAENPQVAVDANGNALVVWQRPDGAGDVRIQLRRRSASGSLATTKTLSAAGQAAERPQVAMDANGNAYVVWSRFDGGSWRIQGQRVTGG